MTNRDLKVKPIECFLCGEERDERRQATRIKLNKRLNKCTNNHRHRKEYYMYKKFLPNLELNVSLHRSETEILSLLLCLHCKTKSRLPWLLKRRRKQKIYANKGSLSELVADIGETRGSKCDYRSALFQTCGFVHSLEEDHGFDVPLALE